MSMDKVNPTAVSIEKPVLLLVSLNEAQLEAGPRELLGAEQVWRLEGEMGFHREPRWRPESVTAASGQLHTQSQTAWRVRFLHCRGMPEETDSGRGGGGGTARSLQATVWKTASLGPAATESRLRAGRFHCGPCGV